MKNNKKQEVKIYFDDNYFNKSINPLFFEIARLTVHKNEAWKHGWRASRVNNAFFAHKNLPADIPVGMGWLTCPD